jgi:hypothetical protein
LVVVASGFWAMVGDATAQSEIDQSNGRMKDMNVSNGRY